MNFAIPDVILFAYRQGLASVVVVHSLSGALDQKSLSHLVIFSPSNIFTLNIFYLQETDP